VIDQPLAWKPGLRVGDFKLLDQLGAGGMGVVFLAENVKTGARYAIKTLPESADEDLVLRLKREGEALAQVDAHPNVVRVHSLGAAHGRIYLVMDVAAGGSLDARMKKGPLAPLEAARVVRDLAQGLAHLHGQGVVHRDLKPSNVLFDEEGTPKLVDFGLARIRGGDRLTKTDELLGTPAFMAPEQVLSEHDKIGPWTDVYGLGGVLHYALTGDSPFSSEVLIELLNEVVNEVPPLPSSKRPGIPPELDRVCRRALAKQAEERPTALELAWELDALLKQGSSKKASPRSPLVAFLAGAAILALGAVAFALRGGTPAPSVERPPAVPAKPPAIPQPTPKARRLDWTLSPGDTWRTRIDTAWVHSGANGELGARSEKLGLSWRVESLEPRGAVLAATIESVETEVDGKIVRADGLVGKTFSVVLDPYSGRVWSAQGVTALARALELDVMSLASDAGTTNLLETLLHVAQDGGTEVRETWTVVRPALGARREDPLAFPVSIECQGRELPGHEVELDWTGAAEGAQGDVRELEGQAIFGAARVVRSRVVERITLRESSSRLTYEWTELAR
jgi:tRNA A-37 threonylcarbamoyl transferase component Bud32